MSRKYTQKEVAALRIRQAEIVRQFKEKQKQREFGRGMSTLGEPFTVEKKRPQSLKQSDVIRMQREAGFRD
jgi:hypothetical protein